jgi:hypothetical protein
MKHFRMIGLTTLVWMSLSNLFEDTARNSEIILNIIVARYFVLVLTLEQQVETRHLPILNKFQKEHWSNP